MKSMKFGNFLRRAALPAIMALTIGVATTGGALAASIGQVKNVTGEAFVLRDGSRLPIQVGTDLEVRDVVETGNDGTVGIAFKDNTVLSTGPGTKLSLEDFKFNSATLEGNFDARVDSGTLSVVSGDMVKHRPGAMRIKTPTAILGVRGTEFVVKVD